MFSMATLGAIARFGTIIAVTLATGIGSPHAYSSEQFQLDQRYASIAFAVSNLGLFSSHGDFARFMGRLAIDLTDPTATQIAVTVVADSVRTPWPQETAMLRSADFFDVANHKIIRFTSQTVEANGPGRYQVHGQIELRGVTRPITLTAQLTQESRDPTTGRQIDDFIVTGNLSRHDFGMTADPLFIADRIAIDIHARIVLGKVQGG
jgi:polyisoprenoid-binding protein YceI